VFSSSRLGLSARSRKNAGHGADRNRGDQEKAADHQQADGSAALRTIGRDGRFCFDAFS
jgi:hypothetical protein